MNWPEGFRISTDNIIQNSLAMRILITGVSGQVGGALALRLQSLGDIVPAPRQLLDLSHPGGIKRRLNEISPDLIVNAAAYTAVDKAEEEEELCFRINAEAVGVIGRWTAERQVPLIHFSTDYVFDGSGGRPFHESTPVNPLSAYGKSKPRGNGYCLHRELPVS